MNCETIIPNNINNALPKQDISIQKVYENIPNVYLHKNESFVTYFFITI